MSPDDPQARIGGYFLMEYGAATGTLASVNLMSAFGSVAGVFAQIHAREMLKSGAWKIEKDAMMDVLGKNGHNYCLGNAINVALFGARREGLTKECGVGPEGAGLWNYIAAAANDPAIERKIDLDEITKHNAIVVGTSDYGVPRSVDGYLPSENMVAAAKRHYSALQSEMNRLNVRADQYVYVFGASAQRTVAFTSGKRDFNAAPKLPPIAAIQLFMEAAISTSKLDLSTIADS